MEIGKVTKIIDENSWRLEVNEESMQCNGMLSSLEAFVNYKRMRTKF